MRIVAIADTHLYHDDLRVLPEGDVLIHAGDLLQRGDLSELDDALAWLASQPHARKILVAGNHDMCFERHAELVRPRLAQAGICYLEHDAVEIDGVHFWGSPLVPMAGDWAFGCIDASARAERWSHIPTHTDVLITHGPARGIGDLGYNGSRFGCDRLTEAIARVRPRLHVFGHIHEDGGMWSDGHTCSINATTWECERDATVIDLEHGRVIPVIVPPARAIERR